MKTFRMIGFAMVAILMCLSACSSGGDDPIDSIIPDPKPEVVAPEITIDSSILANGLNFTSKKGEQSITFTTNEDWTISVAAPTSGASWCTPSVVSGSKGIATVKFSVLENADYENRSVTVTIKASSATKTFTITQKCAEALLITTNKYELGKEGGTVEIEVKANIDYKMEIAETAKSWITESSTRALKAYKHTLKIAASEESVKREGEVRFVSASKVENVKIYQSGEAVLLLSKNEYSVSDKGATVSVDVKGNVDFGVRMPNVDWITDEASSRGMSSHTLKYVVSPNGTYDGRSAEIVFYDKNSSLKETLKITQVQKDALIVSKKEFVVQPEGETIEVELNSNVDFDLSVADNWVTRVEGRSSRGLVSHKLYFQVVENGTEAERSTQILITDKKKQISEAIVIKQKYKEKNIPYLTFSADAAQTLTMSKAVATLQYSVKGGEWKELGTNTVEFGGDKGDLCLRGKSAIGTATSTEDYAKISFGKDVDVASEGDIRTLVDYANYITANTSNARFCYLFEGCSQLTAAPELPATVLADRCYQKMFKGCTDLTQTPELPATTLAEACYQNMFEGCIGLTNAPELPATQLAALCYSWMFNECSNLTQAPELPVMTLAEKCYKGMFLFCTSLTKAPELPATTLADACYEYMFNGCSNLTQAPELPATTLTYCSYERMFYGCSKLNSIKMLATDISAERCLWNWVEGVASTGTFTKAAAMTSLPTGASGIPTGWTVINEGETDDIPYVTFTAENEQALTMSKAVATIQYSIKGGEWNELGTNTVEFGGDKGDLRLRGTNLYGTAKLVGNELDYSQINFGDEQVLVSCSGDIRTLLDYTNHLGVETKDARFVCLFNECSNLISAPELPATSLATYCYHNMFQCCYKLKSAPELPATKMAAYCYDGMFNYCSSLTTAPELPATELATNCYHMMFHNCFQLRNAPELPATTMVYACYNLMFANCTNLIQAPELPAKVLAAYCYTAMFSGCSSLESLSELPATKLDDSCYEFMFRNCVSLKKSPILPATKLDRFSYDRMFDGCTNLNEITMLATDISAEGCLNKWVNNVASTGTFTKAASMKSLPTGASGIPTGWTVLNDNHPYVTFSANAEQALTMSKAVATLQYSVNGGEWKELGTNTVKFGGDKGDLRLRGENLNGTATSESVYSKISFANDNVPVACSGDIRTLIDYKKHNTVDTRNAKFCYLFNDCSVLTTAPELPARALADFCYYRMFNGCISLTTAPELPANEVSYFGYYEMFMRCTSLETAPALLATILDVYCYGDMFSGCTSLKTAPTLPATTLAESCYDGMFSGCTSLKTAPALPATTLAGSCYDGMFSGCTNLITAPALPAATMKPNCYQRMFSGCTSLGAAPALPATTLDIYCYDSMFYGCTALTEAPVLPATSLAMECYASMFAYCTNLKTVKDLPATTLAVDCYKSMFSGCTSLKTAPKLLATAMAAQSCVDMFNGCIGLISVPDLPATTLADNCYERMFAGCTSLTTAPQLLATTLDFECYKAMFSGCTSLTTAPALPVTVLAQSCYVYMFKGCTSLTTAPQLPATTLKRRCYEYMFSGCTSLSNAPVLSAKKLEERCYDHMFNGCKKLSAITMLATDISASKCLDSWVYGVASTGTFTKNIQTNIPVGTSGIPKGWSVVDKQ